MKILSILFLFFLCISCDHQQTQTTKESKVLFQDLINVSDIERVISNNNSGTVELDENQLLKFKQELNLFELHSCCPTKPGAISIEMIISGDMYSGYSSTGSNLICFYNLLIKKGPTECNDSECFFEMPKGVNLDNYK